VFDPKQLKIADSGAPGCTLNDFERSKVSTARNLNNFGVPYFIEPLSFADLVHGDFVKRGVRDLLPHFVGSTLANRKESLRLQMFLRLLQIGNDALGVGTAHKVFTALAFLTRDLAEARDKAKFAASIVDAQQIKDLWTHFTTGKSSRVTIPVPNAVAALQKTLPCLSRRQARQFQNMSSKISSKLFESRAFLKHHKSIGTDIQKEMSNQEFRGFNKEPTVDLEPSPTPTFERDDPGSPTSNDSSRKSDHHKKVGKYLDFDVMVDCFAQTVQVIETQQLYAFLRWYRTFSKIHGEKNDDLDHCGCQVGEVKPWVLERLVGYFTGVKTSAIFYQLYQKAIRYTSPEDQVGTFDPMIFAQSLINVGLDFGRLVGAYKIMHIMLTKKQSRASSPSGPRMTKRRTSSSKKSRKITPRKTVRKTGRGSSSPSGRKTDSEGESSALSP
jgi:hypothetical protein